MSEKSSDSVSLYDHWLSFLPTNLRQDLDAFCSGRTILPKSNSWKVDLGPMLPTSEIVRNALLALASTYLLGYTPDDNLRILANKYYHAAVMGLTKRLQDTEQWEVGRGDDIVATFSLLNLHDVSPDVFHPNSICMFVHS